MYKTFMTLSAAALLLTACGSNDTDIRNTESTEENRQQSGQTDVVQEDSQGNNQPKEETQRPSEESVNQEKWSSLPEYDTIIQQIGDKDYQFKTVTDNEGDRILLIEQDGKERYKTIYVKKTKRLKIIQLDREGQIFNEVLQK
ncbi:hypothetical protein [Paenibacillus sp. FJAT-26967]|uniref:hypothetical protein n=1 Tax=Paenibacillus sp. FJAT-26967 TaxID=1729690 RepID=UPI00083849CF|nr:hypothetical protein [Paenibacillus sp. FJAT-26967]